MSRLISRETVQNRDLGSKWGDLAGMAGDGNDLDKVVSREMIDGGHSCEAAEFAVQNGKARSEEPKKQSAIR